MTFITQHRLIPTFNWLLIVEREYSAYEMDTQLKAFCHDQRCSVIFLSLVLNFIPREHEIILIIVRTPMIMKMYLLLNSASLRLN